LWDICGRDAVLLIIYGNELLAHCIFQEQSTYDMGMMGVVQPSSGRISGTISLSVRIGTGIYTISLHITVQLCQIDWDADVCVSMVCSMKAVAVTSNFALC